MYYIGAFVYGMRTDEDFLTVKSKTLKYVLNGNQSMAHQRISTQTQSQIVSNRRDRNASIQSQSVPSRRSQRISSQKRVRNHSTQSQTSLCRKSQRISSQTVSDRRSQGSSIQMQSNPSGRTQRQKKAIKSKFCIFL